MKRVAFATLLSATLVGTAAQAADSLPAYKAPPLAVPAAYNWSGIYIGAGIGNVWSQTHRFMPNLPLVGVPPTTFGANSSDIIYNLHLGVQWQWGNWVFGLEGTWNGASNDMRQSVSVSPPEPFTQLSATMMVTNLVTIGPRIGYAWDRFMVYATGGYAGANVNGIWTCTVGGAQVFPGRQPCNFPLFGPLADLDLTGKSWNNGWFLGFGFDYVAFKGSFGDILIGAEYQHFDLERKDGLVCTPARCPGIMHQSFSHDAKGDIVRLRLTWKVNPFGTR